MTHLIISVCCQCGKELGRKPLVGGHKYMYNKDGNVTSHSVCDSCGPKLYGKYWKDVKENE
jgi:hypothetical protein